MSVTISEFGKTLALTLLGVVSLVGCESLQLGVSGEPQTTLETILGRVLVIRGNQYVVAEKGLTLELGDQVATLADSGATVLYGLVNEQSEPVGKSCSVTIAADAEHFVSSLEECQGKPKPEPTADQLTDEDVPAQAVEQPVGPDSGSTSATPASTESSSVAEVIASWFQPKQANNNPAPVALAPTVTTSVLGNSPSAPPTPRGLPIVKLKPNAANDTRISNPPLPTAPPGVSIAQSTPSPVPIMQPTVVARTQGGLPAPIVAPIETQTASVNTDSNLPGADSAPIYYAVFAPNLGKTPAILAAGQQAAVAFFIAPAVDTGVGQTGLRASVISQSALSDSRGEQPLLVNLECAICANLNQTQTVMDYIPAKGRSGRAVFKFTPTQTAAGTGLLKFQVTGSSGTPQTVAVQVKVQ